MSDFEAIVFDCDNTMLALDPSREQICIDALATLGFKFSEGVVQTAYRIVDFSYRQKSSEQDSPQAREDYYREYNERICHVLGIAESVQSVHEALRRTFAERRAWRPRPGLVAALNELARFSLHVLANWDSGLHELLESHGLARHFDSIHPSATLGVEKPDRRAFEEFAMRTGLTLERCVYVGNEYTADIWGSRSVGMKPVLFDAAGHYSDEADTPVVRSWPDFVELIRGL